LPGFRLGRSFLMPNGNVLLKRDFEVSKDEALYKVEAVAVFETHGFNLTEVGGESGMYHFSFTFRGQFAGFWQPDKELYSRDQAKAAAEQLFAFGSVRTYVENQIPVWVALGL